MLLNILLNHKPEWLLYSNNTREVQLYYLFLNVSIGMSLLQVLYCTDTIPNYYHLWAKN